ncbi:hypothetical protein [Ralstonia pseudosolanacearum]|uniref:hypothetical protein n=1 Tax=Ralstonia pseudosolanacearum TaxID=1310165 RepID=UPI003CF69973
MATAEHLTRRHLQLSEDSTLQVAERYRQLAAFHVGNLDYRRAIQAMWASTVPMDQFVSLEGLAASLRGLPAPLWLQNSGEAVDYPSCEVEEWLDVEGLAEQHADISSMAISPRVKSIHGAISYILSGRYGFAVQCLKSSEPSGEALSLGDLASGLVAVDPTPTWVDCWADRE